MNIANRQYWKQKSGRDYQRQQAYRIESGNSAYRLQEEWLLRFLMREGRRRRLDRALRVLDFGCGFGRLAAPISALQGVAYYGYDFSQAMAADLLGHPPTALAPMIRERVRVADTVEAAFPGEHFDIIFTISVLIHNDEDQARNLLEQLTQKLAAEEGRLVLIENRAVATTLFQNNWHAGCWAHAFADYAAGRWDIEIFDGLGGQHGIYVLSAPAVSGRSRFTYHEAPGGRGKVLSLEGLQIAALPYALELLRSRARHAPEPAPADDLIAARLHDLLERNGHLERRNAEMMEARLARLRLDDALGPLVRSGRSSGGGETALQAPLVEAGEPTVEAKREPPAVWDADRDIRYAHANADFAGCLHVFHQEWFGIRAAAGSLPGRKLAITAERPLGGRVLSAIARDILDSAPERIVFHGLSDNMLAITETLARRGCAERMFMVHHGAPPQWLHEPERGYLFASLRLAQSGAIRRLNVMRAGFDVPVKRLFRPVLFNLSPRLPSVGIEALPERAVPGGAFIPGWGHWRKNIIANAMGAALSPGITEIWAYARDLTLPEALKKPIRFKRYQGRESGMRTAVAAELCLNVSLVDCHPMVNLEAQALGRPCLRGPLCLDALEDHPYVRLTEVRDVSSIAEIRDRIDAVLAVPVAERRELISDYQCASDAVAFQRYREFLEL
ncbi:class I SAM-dependent methyltransferase [Chelatococcus asaccharovorans]|uniref:class I SAM-dependent methyltransferase n=1 Tax=Chelatococcus asaccharovorans TaxID=28210 RepID=UPI00224C76FF|nr:class I SAM-dependent methyltransferase [Chelatococcus asaccharovorans]CAH1669462.1 Methyltransferase family protein [Chelatococcus asaccharovorans]CAH1679084.1 Methyltransferase family protein [Chelatococcus asaccharovorans]